MMLQDCHLSMLFCFFLINWVNCLKTQKISPIMREKIIAFAYGVEASFNETVGSADVNILDGSTDS